MKIQPSMKRYVAVLWTLSFVCATASASNPKLEEVFQSVQSSMGESVDPTRLFALVLAIIAVVTALIAVRRFSSQERSPSPLHSSKKLLNEVAKKTRVPKKSLRNLASLTEAQGFSSPLVVMLCPSVLTSLAKNAQTKAQQQAILEVATEIESQADR